MTIRARVRGLLEWYRALRALNRILATLGMLALVAGLQTGGPPRGPATPGPLPPSHGNP
jgi:hypothetical protein